MQKSESKMMDFSWVEVRSFLKSGALLSLLLGAKEVLDFELEAELDSIIVEVKISRLDFFLLGWTFQTLGEESDKESNKDSDDFAEEVLFFGWGEGVTKSLG